MPARGVFDLRRLGGPGRRSHADPTQPVRRMLELVERWQGVGRAPDLVQPLYARLLDDAVAEGLAERVLPKLELQTDNPEDHLAQAAAARPARLQALAEPGIARIEALGG